MSYPPRAQRTRALVGRWRGGAAPTSVSAAPRPMDAQASMLRANMAACGLPLCPASFRIGGTSGSDTKLCQPCSSQSNATQTRSASVGSRNTVAPLDPCCRRLSAPLVENTSRKRSKSSTCVVASNMDGSFRRWMFGMPSGGERGDAHLPLLGIDRAQLLDHLEVAVSDLGDVHVHAHVVLAGHHCRRPARPFADVRVVERGDDVGLLQRARLFDG